MRLPDLETRVTKLNSAFSHFSQELRFALGYIESDAASSLTKSRVVLEKLLIQVYSAEMGQKPRKTLLGDMLADAQFTRRLERRIVSRMNSIRDMANLGPHGEAVEPEDAVRVLDDLCEVLEWYLRRYPISPACGSGWEQLYSIATFTDRICPVVVDEDLSPLRFGPDGQCPQIRLGSRVFWTIRWDVPAHLLLLDHEREGKTFCICPSWFAPDTRLEVGTNLLPPESARCEPFVITGIPGREDVLAIVSGQPLCLDWMPPDRSRPTRILSEGDVTRLLDLLNQLPPANWTALKTHFEIIV